MDARYFLKTRTDFIRFFYEEGAKGFGAAQLSKALDEVDGFAEWSESRLDKADEWRLRQRGK